MIFVPMKGDHVVESSHAMWHPFNDQLGHDWAAQIFLADLPNGYDHGFNQLVKITSHDNGEVKTHVS